ncbi:hypothetical protein HZA57_00990, partial [Candidatus Poribacteria bacterium]|nr:hypothetical protein [Candidatus Poribacteria bacterium]
DVTESLRIVLDSGDRLLDYTLIKRTCGRAVGERSLILDWAKGRTAGELLAVAAGEFLDAFSPEDETHEFLLLKHLLALQGGLAVFTGAEAGAAGSPCAAESVTCGETGFEFLGQLRVDILTDRIRACGRCAGCGVRREAAAH